ncbi:hypothetical protein MIC448_320010 [Microbacterium sp. C448]|nr:hypothetical protein [Microbacterium sp. C448]CDK00706.1 hypothetical protein MIC448_320010 [Microbacterium sp. C448]
MSAAPAALLTERSRADLMAAIERLEASLVRLSASFAADIERNTADA